MQKRLVAMLILAMLGWCGVVAAADAVLDLPVVPADKVGFDAAALAEFDEVIGGAVESGKLAGALMLLARDEEVGYLETWGHRDLDSGEEMTVDTIFRIYSMSKPITSMATMQLVEQGKMALDDPVAKYLPELGDVKVYVDGDDGPMEVSVQRQITVRDLLRHTSGFTYGFFGATEVDKRYTAAGILRQQKTIAEMVEKLGALPLLYQPGSRWHYSVSTDVLGRLVEVVSEQPYDEYLHEHIFEPLDMQDTFFVVPKEKLDRFAALYVPSSDGLQSAPEWRSANFTNPKNEFFSGGGGLCSTVRDYYRFCRAMLNRGELDGTRVLRAETVAEMTRNQLDDNIERDEGFEFGLGYAIRDEGEFSWGGAAGTKFFINPERNLIAVYMVQIIPPGNRDLGGEVRRIAYEAAK